MASTDARPVPVKGQAYRVTFPVFASDGSLTPGVTLLSQISIDAASAVYGARPVEISANMGMYYLDLTAGEMNGQTIAVVATPIGGGTGANIAIRSVPIVLYTQGPTAGFYAQVMSIDATPLDGIASTVWASSSRGLTSFGNIVNAVWATPTRALTDWAGIVNTVWATPTRTLSAGVTVAAGGIDSTSFAASAVDAAALAQDAAQEVADEMLNRNLAGSGSGGARIVRDALRVLRNKVDANLGIVYQENDSTTAWTFTTTSDALATRITGVDPG